MTTRLVSGVPIYEYRCQACGAVTRSLESIHDLPPSVECASCAGVAMRIVSSPAVHRSRRSKVARLDPKYDKMIDSAMRGSTTADPDRLVNRRGDIAKGKPD